MNIGLNFVMTTGIIANVVLLYILAKKRRKRNSPILAIFFALVLLIQINAFGLLNKIAAIYYVTILFVDIATLMTSLLLYFYIKDLFTSFKLTKNQNLVHFIPILLYFLTVSLPIYLNGLEFFSLGSYTDFLKKKELLISLISNAYLLYYVGLSLKFLQKIGPGLSSYFSSLTIDDYKWLRVMLYLITVVIVIDTLFEIYELYFGNLDWNSYIITIISISIFVVVIGYKGISQTSILIPDFILENEERAKESTKKKATNEIIKSDQENLNRLKLEVLKSMEESKPYLNEDLTLTQLANIVSTTDKKLSFLLNQYMDTNFYDFINHYRVLSVIEKMSDPEFNKFTLTAIAEASGFKSKSSFNRIFRKETGLTPTEYKKSMR